MGYRVKMKVDNEYFMKLKLDRKGIDRSKWRSRDKNSDDEKKNPTKYQTKNTGLGQKNGKFQDRL